MSTPQWAMIFVVAAAVLVKAATALAREGDEIASEPVWAGS